MLPPDVRQAEIIPNPEAGLSHTKSKYLRFRFTWTIKNFEYNVGYESPPFSPGGKGEFQWCLKLMSTMGGSLDLYICLLPCYISAITIKYTVSLINASGKIVIRSLSPKTHQAVSATEPTVFKVMRDFTTSDMIEGMEEVGPGRDLTISCEIQHPDQLNIPVNGIGLKVPEPQLLNDIRHLFEGENNHSDVKIICGQIEYNLHKAILSVRSPVFASMLKDRKTESSNRLTVTDVDDQVFGEMLRYIYTDQVRSIETMADRMLAAATKFGLVRLRLLCENSLCADLTIDNAADKLMLADDHNGEELKSRAIEFILANAREIIDVPGFESMFKSHPALMVAVFKAFVTRTSLAEKSLIE